MVLVLGGIIDIIGWYWVELDGIPKLQTLGERDGIPKLLTKKSSVERKTTCGNRQRKRKGKRRDFLQEKT